MSRHRALMHKMKKPFFEENEGVIKQETVSKKTDLKQLTEDVIKTDFKQLAKDVIKEQQSSKKTNFKQLAKGVIKEQKASKKTDFKQLALFLLKCLQGKDFDNWGFFADDSSILVKRLPTELPEVVKKEENETEKKNK